MKIRCTQRRSWRERGNFWRGEAENVETLDGGEEEINTTGGVQSPWSSKTWACPTMSSTAWKCSTLHSTIRSRCWTSPAREWTSCPASSATSKAVIVKTCSQWFYQWCTHHSFNYTSDSEDQVHTNVTSANSAGSIWSMLSLSTFSRISPRISKIVRSCWLFARASSGTTVVSSISKLSSIFINLIHAITISSFSRISPRIYNQPLVTIL